MSIRTCRIYALAAALALVGISAPTAVFAATQRAEADAAGEPSPELEALRGRGIELHDQATEGDEDAAEMAVEQLERYVAQYPADGEARAYLGSAYAMRARDASSVANRVRYANRGVRHLDRALDATPRNFTVRLIRANVNSSLPKMFGRADAAREDMLALDEIYRVAPSPVMASLMVGIYEALQDRAPGAGPWAERLVEARTLAAEQ